MANQRDFAHGEFCWVDLAAHDPAADRGFYESLFAWTAKDLDTQGGPPYVLFELGGQTVAGMGQMPEEMKAQGLPPMWSNYINVDNLEAVAQQASELGGRLAMPIMQIMEQGWMSFLQDPTGGLVGLWQKNQYHGADLVNVPGTFCWNELATRDLDSAKSFFGNLLGWDFETNPDSELPYAHIINQGRKNGGIIQMDERWGQAPPHWMVYFSVANIDESVHNLGELGGNTCVPIFEVPVGRMAVVSDPKGGTFTMIQLNEIEE